MPPDDDPKRWQLSSLYYMKVLARRAVRAPLAREAALVTAASNLLAIVEVACYAFFSTSMETTDSCADSLTSRRNRSGRA